MVSTFEAAIPTVLAHEGGYSNNPADPGGQTNFGISMRWLRANNLISIVADDEGVSHDMVIKAMNVGEADKLYKQYWWDRFGFESIVDQSIATKVFDTAVNIGTRPAVKILQSCCGVSGTDGVLGPVSLSHINSIFYPGSVLNCFRVRQASYYSNLVVINPNLQKFLDGWLNRAYDRV